MTTTMTAIANGTARADERESQIREAVQEALRAEPNAPGSTPAERRARVERLVEAEIATADERAAQLGDDPVRGREAMARRLLDELAGMGPLQPLLDDRTVEEILVNGPGRVLVIRANGEKVLTDVTFKDDAAVLDLVRRAIGPQGRRLDDASPLVDARLPDGSRLHAVVPPITAHVHVTIRKFIADARTLDDLVAAGTLPTDAADFLTAAVRGRLNLLVAGATGSGKTTLLNTLASCITDPRERVVTIEETAELIYERVLPDCVALQARPPNIEGAGEVTQLMLGRHALRMRPSRIVIGEVRGAEALGMLLAMTSGHRGSMCSLHADESRDALPKLWDYALLAPEARSERALMRMIARAVDLVVHLERDEDTGRRYLSSVYEVTGHEDDAFTGNELFVSDGDALRWNGIVPRRERRLRRAGWAGPALRDAREVA